MRAEGAVPELSAGGEEIVARAVRGDYFGELTPMFRVPRTATARARTDTTLIAYSLRDFRSRASTTHRVNDIEPEGLVARS